MMSIQSKRIYEPAQDADGLRILVDRLWPRGVSKESAHVDLWVREAAPSSELRKWFGHDVSRFAEFQKRYWSELANSATHQEAVHTIQSHALSQPVTLLFAARDSLHNNAVVLLDFLNSL